MRKWLIDNLTINPNPNTNPNQRTMGSLESPQLFPNFFLLHFFIILPSSFWMHIVLLTCKYAQAAKKPALPFHVFNAGIAQQTRKIQCALCELNVGIAKSKIEIALHGPNKSMHLVLLGGCLICVITSGSDCLKIFKIKEPLVPVFFKNPSHRTDGFMN